MSIARNMGKNTSKNLTAKYRSLLIMLKNLLSIHLKKIQGLKRAIKKRAEATGHLTGNKIADKITRPSKFSPKNNSETNEKEILIERFISPEKKLLMNQDKNIL